MWINKSEIIELSNNIRSSIDGKDIDFRDNHEGALSILKNDINTLVHIKKEQMDATKRERDILSDCLADISHQLKTPITSMMIMTELLDTAPEEKREEFTHNIKLSLTRMEWLVTVLLKMAKLDSGAVAFSKQKIQAHDLLKNALQPLEILFDVKNQTVVFENDEEILCDKQWTVEALTNVLKNASEYSPEGGTIHVNSGTNPIYTWIAITDSGIGLQKEQCAKLFKRFEHSSSENGYGIGLPLALSIMRGQNGDIDIDGGAQNSGATFTLKFYK